MQRDGDESHDPKAGAWMLSYPDAVVFWPPSVASEGDMGRASFGYRCLADLLLVKSAHASEEIVDRWNSEG
jgi:hypothetical protein